jgi:hypothetical protein
VKPRFPVRDLPLFKVCSTCSWPAIGWFWSKEQGYIGWCRDHVVGSVEVSEQEH